ncbi:putative membrane protein [Thermacetogenium phaeum DSM 12270]|uniref:Putative membrane protein n=1 Tax=Thermacetogenium phaeum (strain ATCC BAA-254 / DSM 26808 / PB) TaxID=1089553 RepID=K4LF77_THEPS|nr:HlyD family efflux transporter periplasmic adaptor subunit [Thermacetogenium phaeum]AFV11503.1 putative membrane protein [Thermacetogenium phaeum DSM 12270]
MAGHPVGLRRVRQRRKAVKKKVASLTGRFLIFLLVGVSLFWFGKQLYGFCIFQIISTVQAERGVLEDTYGAQGLLLLQETVVRAPAAGKVVPLVKEGDRVPTGKAVVRLDPHPDLAAESRSRELTSPCPGIVSFHFDGWEGALDRNDWESYDPLQLFESLDKQDGRLQQKDEVRCTGEPVFKIIDNLVNPYMFLRLESGSRLSFEEGDLLRLEWGDSGKGRMKVLSLIRRGGAYYAGGELLAARPFPVTRRMTFRVISNSFEGVVLPTSTLVKNGGVTGVITKSPLGLSFKKVDVVGVVGDRVVVKGIAPGVNVVTNPRLASMMMGEI